MYINKIDDLIDKIIDDFYGNVFVTNFNKKLYGDINFAKKQKELNAILVSYNDTIDTNEIKNIVQSGDNIDAILEIIHRYLAYYFFLYIGTLYEGTLDNYTSNIIEYSKNQVNYNYKIQNFFNSENNSILIGLHKMIKYIYSAIDNNKIDDSNEAKSAKNFLDYIGPEFVDASFRINNEIDSGLQSHNIIKTVIILELYKKNEKKQVYDILESIANPDDEFTFIEISVPKKQYIDYNSVENILTRRELIRDMANEFWNYIVEHEENVLPKSESLDDKILLLINSGILVPIVDDFLLYHKDTEKYDKNIDADKIKKKEDTKIRYVVDKIEKTSEYYSESANNDSKLKNEIKKNFFQPLMDRKAILINNNEDLKIISKFLNMSKKSAENMDYFNDLATFREYPYINFKDFEKFGTSIFANNTANAIRSVSFNKNGDFRQNVSNPVQLRVISEGQNVHLVGFAIPTNKQDINCLKVKDFVNIKSVDKNNKNGYNLMMNYIRKGVLQSKPHNSSVYWLFDANTDTVKVDTYEHNVNEDTIGQFKNVIGKLYDEITKEMYYRLTTEMTTRGPQEIQLAYTYVKQYEKKYMKIPKDSSVYDDLENFIYFDNSIKIIPKYDEREDIFYGLTGDIIKLEYAPPIKQPVFPTIKVDTLKMTERKKEILDIEVAEGVCQHNITWEYITSIRKKNPGKYTDLLYEFIQQYVVENSDQDYLCKSCGTLLNIKKYILDGEYDGDTQKFITYSMPMEVALEDIAEYEKYKPSIRNIDKLLERIAVIANIPYFMGSSLSIKWRRKAVIKDVIDLLLLNNSLLKNNFKERNELATKIYGISRDLSNLFVFDLDNDIFKYSSKEKDYYKPIKQNNVLAYIVILLILEINDSQLTFMTGDKKGLCNFPIYDKYGHVLFDGLKIRKNRQGDLDNIKNYPVLCYVLYIMSCMIVKYNMWFFNTGETDADKDKKKKFNPVVQKSVIHTIIDLLNSVIENSANKEVHHIYEIVSIRFFKKLQTMFNNVQIMDKFRSDRDKTSVADDKKTYILTKSEPIKLVGYYDPHPYIESKYIFCRLPRYIIPSRKTVSKQYYDINNITNCPGGTFHSWKTKGKDFVCEICNTNLNNLKVDEKQSENILIEFKYSRLQKLAQKYCLSGSIHNFVFDKEKGTSICIKCNKSETHKYSKKELDELHKNLQKKKKEENNIEGKRLDKEHFRDNKEDVYKKEVVDQLVESYKKSVTKEDTFKFINTLVTNMQNSIGTVSSINNFDLKDNIYVIDHDYLGYPYSKPIYISEKDNLIKFKSNHPFFKTDVYYYTNTKNSRVDVFYDTNTMILLGYKENSKDYVISMKPDKKLKVNYSTYNKLKIMGYESKFIPIQNKLNDIKDIYVGIEKWSQDSYGQFMVSEDNMTKILFRNLIRDRISNLKKVIYEFQRFLYRIKNNFTENMNKASNNTEENEEKNDDEINMIEITTQKYFKKLSGILIHDNVGKHRIFKHWKAVISQLQPDNLDDININININDKLLDSDYVNNFDINGNLILFYITSEMNKLIDYNANKVIKENIINFFIEFIDIMFDMFNIESKLNNHDIKRFILGLQVPFYAQDDENIITGETVGIYQEYKDIDDKETEEDIEANEDAREEEDALDMDFDLEFGEGPDNGDGFDYQSQYDYTYADAETVPENTFWEPTIPNPFDN